MVMDFDKDKVLTQKKRLNHITQIIKKLLDEMAELGLLGIDIPEEFGGIDLDKITSAIVAERLSIAHLLPLHGLYKPALVLCH